jgi:flagella basal body P-ring formation protein FlgA
MQPKAEVCLERAVEPLSPAQLLEAIRISLDRTDARIEIVDYCRHPAPHGKLEFPRAGLIAPPASQPNAAALWTGSVRYGGNRRFPVWVKARILVKAQRVVAAQTLPAGARIEAGQLRLEESEGFPQRAAPLDNLEQAVGRVPRRSIPAGSVLSLSQLSAPLEVSRGDTVRVQVTSGDAHLELQGRAEASGRAGEIIPVRNLANGKRFSARVDGPGRAVAEVHP